jgi:hypothetical protein
MNNTNVYSTFFTLAKMILDIRAKDAADAAAAAAVASSTSTTSLANVTEIEPQRRTVDISAPSQIPPNANDCPC